MSTHEVYCSLDICKLLKEAGFDWEVKYYYRDNFDSLFGDKQYIDFNNNPIIYTNCISAPTLDIAQRWLREVKNIDVYIFPTTNIKRECVYQMGIKTFGRTLWIHGQPSTTEYVSYEEAQEAGIKKAIEIILEKGE